MRGQSQQSGRQPAQAAVHAYVSASVTVFEYNAEGEALCKYDVGVGAVNMLLLE